MQFMLELVRSLVGAIAGIRDRRRDHVERIANFLDAIATALEGAAKEQRAGRLPVREYAELHRYAETFETVVIDAFPGSRTATQFEPFWERLNEAIGIIAALDAVLTGFVEIPLPPGVWHGKSDLIRQEDLPTLNPPAGKGRQVSNLSYKKVPEPQRQQLIEAAADFRAQANVLRAL